MKKIIISILLVMLTGCAALYQVPTEIPVDTSFVPVINISGCIGQPLDVCINTMLSQNKALYLNKEKTKQDINQQLQKLKEVDVNGKLISDKRSIIIVSDRWLYTKDHFAPIIDNGYLVFRTIEYNTNNIVTKVSTSWIDIIIASSNTLEEYDKTPLYSELQMILGKNCPDRITVYKFFQNIVKPNIKHYAKQTTANWNELSERRLSSTDINVFAGYSFMYQEHHENSIDSITTENSTGLFLESTIIISIPGY